jgi:hypothetical protein
MSKDLNFDLGKPAPKKAAPKKAPAKKKTVRNIEQPESASLVDMSFKVSPEFRQAFKTYASERGISMKKALEKGFELLRENES